MKTTSFLRPRVLTGATAAAALLAIPALRADDGSVRFERNSHVEHNAHFERNVHVERAVHMDHVDHVDRVVHFEHRPVVNYVPTRVVEHCVTEHVVVPPRFVEHVVTRRPEFIRERRVNVVHFRGHIHRGYVVTFANGFHGRGYYYGPPNMTFYTAGPDVDFFATPDAVPAELQDGSADDSAATQQDTQDPTATADTQAPNPTPDNQGPNAASDNQANTPEMAVQAALADRRYYNGPVDGRIGVTSTQAIARFQADNRLHVTGTITPELMQALGLN